MKFLCQFYVILFWNYLPIYIYKPFFFVCDIQTLRNTQKSTKAFDSFLRIVFQLCRCRFRLIILEEKFRCKSLGTGVERDLFRTQLSAYKQNMKECKSLHLKVKTSKIAESRASAKKITYPVHYSLPKLKMYLKLC